MEVADKQPPFFLLTILVIHTIVKDVTIFNNLHRNPNSYIGPAINGFFRFIL